MVTGDATKSSTGLSRAIVLLLLGSVLVASMIAPAQSRRLLEDDDDAGDDYDDYDDEELTEAEAQAEESSGRNRWVYLPFIACEDDNLNKLDTGSAKRCQDECEDDDDCLAYSYNTVDGRCFTKGTQCLDQTQNPDNFSAIKMI